MPQKLLKKNNFTSYLFSIFLRISRCYTHTQKISKTSSKTAFVFLLLCLSKSASYAQTTLNYNTKIIPVSPAMATFQRFGDYPVDMSTGLAQVSLPVYTINTSGFSYPITIDFHASGRRTGDDFSTMGVGWALTATGYISREIRGMPDGVNFGYGTYTPLETTSAQMTSADSRYSLQTYYNLRLADESIPNPPSSISGQTKEDAEHDIYSYNVNGISGKFIFDKNGHIVQLTQNDCTILQASYVGPFIIIDKNGNTYYFGQNSNAVENVSVDLPNGTQTTVANGWYLTQITTTTGLNINFSYSTIYTNATSGPVVVSPLNSSTVFSYTDDIQNTDYEVSEDNLNNTNISGGSPTSGPSYTNNYSRRAYRISYLSSITFPNGRLNFSYDNSNLSLSSVALLNGDNNPIRTVQFDYMRTPGTGGGLDNNNGISLKDMKQVGASGVNQETYAFKYYADTLVNSSNGSFNEMRDWWGYSNNTGNKPPIDAASGQDLESYGCSNCKAPLFTNMRSGMIKTIVYPTGGTTDFTYEENQDYYGNPGPGLRIKQISSTDPVAGTSLIKSYTYTGGAVAWQPNTVDFLTTTFNFFLDPYTPAGGNHATSPCYLKYYRSRNYSDVPIPTLAEAYQQPVYYTQVSEYQQDGNGNNLGRTDYGYTIPQSYYNTVPSVYVPQYYTSPKLAGKSVYKYEASTGKYVEIERDITDYTSLNVDTIWQVRIQRNCIIPVDDSNTITTRDLEEKYIVPNYSRYGMTIYNYTDNPIFSGVKVPLTVTHTIFNDNAAAVVSQSNYHYDGINAYTGMRDIHPTAIVETTSHDSTINALKYSETLAYNYKATDTINEGVARLQAQHMIVPIEDSKYRMDIGAANKRLISSTFYSYRPDACVPNDIADIESSVPLTNFNEASASSGTIVRDSRYQKRYQFDHYDRNNNLLQKHEISGPPISYLWAYNRQYPVTEATNAAINQIAYSSCEEKFTDEDTEDINGTNISFYTDDATYFSTDCHTGHYSFNLTDGNEHEISTIQQLPAGKYVFSYWSKGTGSGNSARVSIDETFQILQGVDMNANSKGWEYHELTVNIPTADYFTIYPNDGGEALLIDDIRIHPAGSLMTTYTYDPLVGMTSATDAKGEVTYYEYDDLQRLINIKDKDGNVLKHISYHYQGQ